MNSIGELHHKKILMNVTNRYKDSYLYIESSQSLNMFNLIMNFI